MQRKEPDGIVIACDFCGTDWDEVLPMIEGHHGSILCLECLKKALPGAQPAETRFECVMCLRDLPPTMARWRNPDSGPRANPIGVVCLDCIKQAARAYDRDPDVDWKIPKPEAPKPPA